MGLKTYLDKALNSVLKRYGYEIIRSSSLQELQKYPEQPSYEQSTLPEGATDYLQRNNSRLQELEARYAIFDNRVTAPLFWTDDFRRPTDRPDDIRYFRGEHTFRKEHGYLEQRTGGNMSIMGYALASFYVKSIDKLQLLELLEEDDFFGVVTLRIDNRLVSRDLLDSIMEIYFLEKYLSLSLSKDMTILDIGAGYGRLAHRMVCALPNIQDYLCTDAVAISSFISEYYLRFRGIEGRAKVVPLDEIENMLRNRTVDIAVNIHSFPECRVSAIDWWLSLLEEHRVKYLMIVPHLEPLRTIDSQDFGEIIEKHGYKLVAKDPKYRDPVVQQYAISPTYHYLFELQ